MNNKSPKNNTLKSTVLPLTKKQVREIAKEEIIKWHKREFIPLSK